MGRIAVVTDSTSCIPSELIKKYGIHIVPLYVIWDGVEYRDGVDLPPAEFYKRLRQSTTYPTTTSAVQGGFLELFEKLQGKVDGIVSIVVSRNVPSAAYDSALAAGEMVPDIPLKVVDSQMAMIGLGFVVLAAARKAATGAGLKEVADTARATVPKVSVFYMMESLDYIRKGGRVPMPQAHDDEWRDIKPMITWQDGRLVPFEKQPTKEAAIERLLQLMQEKVTDTPLHAAVMHGDDPEGAEELYKLMSQRFNCSELLMTEFTPIIGAHMGPGALGLAFYNE